jgi:hypothetical protein
MDRTGLQKCKKWNNVNDCRQNCHEGWRLRKSLGKIGRILRCSSSRPRPFVATRNYCTLPRKNILSAFEVQESVCLRLTASGRRKITRFRVRKRKTLRCVASPSPIFFRRRNVAKAEGVCKFPFVSNLWLLTLAVYSNQQFHQLDA